MDAHTEFYNGLKTNFADTIKKSAASEDVIKFIVSKVNEHANSPFAKLVVKSLSYGNPTKEQFVKRVFDYVCHSVDYLRDPQGKEIIFSPKLLINRGKGDCKKQSLLIATILKAAGIEPILKVISYGGKDWEHIFVIVKDRQGKQITVDPVNDKKYNEEIKHAFGREYYLNGTKSKIMPNELISMGDKNKLTDAQNILHNSTGEILGHCQNAYKREFSLRGGGGDVDEYFSHLSGDGEEYLGKSKGKLKAKLKNLVNKLVKKGKQVGFAPARAAFLGLILLGKALEHSPLKIHLAEKMALLYDKDAKQIDDFWTKFGGDANVLKKTVLKGVKVGINGNGMGVVVATAAAGAITAATPILIAIMSLLKKAGLAKPHEADAATDALSDAADAHDADGSQPHNSGNNDVIKAGASQGDNGHDNGDDGSGTTKKKSGCFLTTACVEHYGLADNCRELQTLRNFRDNYLLHTDKTSVEFYYVIAPKIVDAMKSDCNKENVFSSVYEKIKLACNYIDKKQFKKAKQLYTSTVASLAIKYKISL